MAKAFSDSEKVLIKDKLKKGAIECMQRYGIRKASVDELVKYAGISKGAFYLFYESKELLFFEAAMEYHERLHETIQNYLTNIKGEVTPDILTELLFKVIKDNQSFWVSLLSNGDLDYIQRKLPNQMEEIHLLDDEQFFNQLLELIPASPDANIEVISAAFRAIFLTILNVETIGESVYDDALKVLLKGVIQQLYRTPIP